MSRIVLTRHPNGEEHVVAGWDRPLDTAFVDEYDEHGDALRTRGSMSGEKITPAEATIYAAAYIADSRPDGIFGDRLVQVLHTLREHQTLDYPASNCEVDMSREPICR